MDSNGVMEPTENVATIERGAIVVEGVGEEKEELGEGREGEKERNMG